MISKNPNTQKVEAKLMLETANKLFIAGMTMLVSVNFIDDILKVIITLPVAVLLIYKSATINKKMLHKLDSLERNEVL